MENRRIVYDEKFARNGPGKRFDRQKTNGGREMKTKLTSRKFWISVAAFLGSIGVSIAGIQCGSENMTIVGVVCSTLSAAIYAACEAAVDKSSKE